MRPTHIMEDNLLYKNKEKNYTEKVLMTRITMMVWSLRARHPGV